MLLSDFSIKRPVCTTMVMVGLAVFGWICFRSLGVDLFPRVEFPVITIVSVLPGADPHTIETTVSKPIEDALSSISSIKHIRSTSADSVSQVVIQFELEKSVDIAFQEVQAKLGSARSLLPEDLEDPIVEKFEDTVVLTSLSVLIWMLCINVVFISFKSFKTLRLIRRVLLDKKNPRRIE